MSRFMQIFIIGLTSLLISNPVAAQMLEANSQRVGATYVRGAIGNGGPEQCWSLCAQDARCKAWTWERPGVSGPQGMCSLKAAVTPGHFSPCCVSGVSARLEQQIELGLNGSPRQRQIAATRVAPRGPVSISGSVITAPVLASSGSTRAPLYSVPPQLVRRAPVRPVPPMRAVPRRTSNGVPLYSVSREIQASPTPAMSTATTTQSTQSSAPVKPAPSTASLRLLGE